MTEDKLTDKEKLEQMREVVSLFGGREFIEEEEKANKEFLQAIEKEKKRRTPCDWCDSEAGVEVHKLDGNRICDRHASDVYGAMAEDMGYMV